MSVTTTKATGTTSGAPTRTFADLIADTGEADVPYPSMPMGGQGGVGEVLRFGQLRQGAVVMEVGCASGATTREYAMRRPDAHVLGTDVRPLERAHRIAMAIPLPNVAYYQVDGRRLPDTWTGLADLVAIGNTPAFVDERDEMIGEAVRCARDDGLLVAIPIYYVASPPDHVRDAVSHAIGAAIQDWREDFWLARYEANGLVIEYRRRYTHAPVTASEIGEYAAAVMDAPENAGYSEAERDTLRAEWVRYLTLFARNNEYAGWSVVVCRRRTINRRRSLFVAAERPDGV